MTNIFSKKTRSLAEAAWQAALVCFQVSSMRCVGKRLWRNFHLSWAQILIFCKMPPHFPYGYFTCSTSRRAKEVQVWIAFWPERLVTAIIIECITFTLSLASTWTVFTHNSFFCELTFKAHTCTHTHTHTLKNAVNLGSRKGSQAHCSDS